MGLNCSRSFLKAGNSSALRESLELWWQCCGPASAHLPSVACPLQDAGSQQVGFLLGSCGVTLALTTDACQKGLPKSQTGEVVTFKGEPPGCEEGSS